jgi:hypothetical protein
VSRALKTRTSPIATQLPPRAHSDVLARVLSLFASIVDKVWTRDGGLTRLLTKAQSLKSLKCRFGNRSRSDHVTDTTRSPWSPAFRPTRSLCSGNIWQRHISSERLVFSAIVKAKRGQCSPYAQARVPLSYVSTHMMLTRNARCRPCVDRHQSGLATRFFGRVS